MSNLLNLVAGALFLGFLASTDGQAVPLPQSNWNDDVGKDIDDRARQSLSRYNKAVKNCNETLSRVKTEASSKALEVNFASKANELNWQAEQINNVRVEAIADRMNQILRQ